MSVSVLDNLAGLLVGFTVRATALLVLAFLAAILLRKSAAQLRHALWAAVFVALLLLPLSALAPAWHVPLPKLAGQTPLAAHAPLVPGGDVPVAPPVRPDPAWLAISQFRLVPGFEAPPDPPIFAPVARAQLPAAKAAPSWSDWAFWVLGLWLLGAAICLKRVIGARLSARRLVYASRPADPKLWLTEDGFGHLDLRESENIDLPVTLGVWRPTVLVPAAARSWPPAWRKAALVHERAHLRRWDSALQALADAVTSVFWFHPLVWLAERQLRVERELAADDAVLSDGSRASEYAQFLIELATGPGSAPHRGAVVPLLTRSGLKTRLLGLLDERRQRRAGAWSLALLGIVGLGLTLPAALVRPVTATAAQSAKASPGAPRPPGTPVLEDAYLLGRALDEDGRPIAGAEVHLLTSMVPIGRLTSDAEGWITFPPAFRHPHERTFDVYLRKGDLAMRRTIHHVPFGTKLPLDFVMRPAAVVSGRVHTADGVGVPGVEVLVGEWQRWAVGPGVGPLATSGPDGRFEVEGLLYGTYRLVFRAPSGAMTHHGIKLDQSDATGLDVTLWEKETVTAFLQDGDDRPLSGVVVHRFGPWWPRGGRSITAGERHIDWDRSDERGAVRIAPRGRTLFAETESDRGEIIAAAFPDGGEPLGHLDWATPKGRSLTVSSPRFVRLEPPVKIAGHARYQDGRPAGRAGLRVDLPRVGSFTLSTDAGGGFSLPRLPFRTVILEGERGAARTRLDLEAGESRDVELVLPAPTP